MTKEELLECCETNEQRSRINLSFAVCERTGKTSSYATAETKEDLLKKFQLEDELESKKAFNKVVSNALSAGKTYDELKKAIITYINADILKQLDQLKMKEENLKAQIIEL